MHAREMHDRVAEHQSRIDPMAQESIQHCVGLIRAIDDAIKLIVQLEIVLHSKPYSR